MDAEIIVSCLIEKLNENKSIIVHPMFGNTVGTAIENLKLLKRHLRKYQSVNGAEMARLLKAVYSAEDAINDLLTRKQQQQQRERRGEISVREGEGILMDKEELERQQKKLTEEIEQLNREEKELRRLKEDLRRQELGSGVEELQRKEEESRRKKEKLQRKEKELQIKKEKWNRKNEEEELRLRENKERQRENEELQKEKEEFLRKNEEMLRDNEASRRDREKSLREKEELLEVLRREEAELQKKREDLKREKEKLLREKEEEELQLRENEERARENEELLKKNEEFQRNNEELLRRNEDFLTKTEGLQRDKEKWLRENKELLEILERKEEELRKKREEFERKEEKRQRNKEELGLKESLNQNNRLLKQKEDLLITYLTDLGTGTKHGNLFFQHLRNNLLRKEIAERQGKAMEFLDKIKELERKKEKWQRDNEEFQRQNQDLQNRNEVLLREIQKLEKHNEELAMEKERLNGQTKELRRDVEETQRKEDELGREREELKRKEIELQIKTEELEKKKEKWQIKDEQCHGESEELLRKDKDLQKRNEVLLRDIEKLKKDMEELRTREEELRRENEETRRQEKELRSEKEELQRKEEELERKKEKWQSKKEEQELQLRENEEFQRQKEESRKQNKEWLSENEDLLRDKETLLRENKELLRDVEKLLIEKLQEDDDKTQRKEVLTAREKFPSTRMDFLGRKVFKRPFMCFKPLYYQILFLREMKKLKNNVQALCWKNDDKGGAADNNDRGQHSQQQRWGKFSNFCLEENRVIGFEEQIKDLVGKLVPQENLTDIDQLQQDCHHRSPQPQVIKVIGVGGSGKTTLTRTVYNKLDVKLHFSIRAWVHVSSVTKGRDLWIDLLKQIDPAKLVQETISEEEMVSRLTKLLKDTRYLIVIDQDVDKPHYWQTLTNALCSSSNKGKIVIITPDWCEVEEKNNVSTEYASVNLVGLDDDEMWELFLEKVRIARDAAPNIKTSLEKCKEEILSLCNGSPRHGSPLRLVMLGGLLSTKTNGNFEEGLKAFWPARPHRDEDFWDLCYQDLPSQVKPCLLYMVLFPRGFEIPVRRLIHLWCAEGFVTSLIQNGQEIAPEDLAEMYFEELVTRNMIQVRWRIDGSPKACCMPSPLYNALCQKATSFGFLYNQRHSPHKSTNQQQFVRRYATFLGTRNGFSSDPFFHVQHLRTYIAFDTRIPGTATIETGMLLKRVMGNRGFRLLKVLDLEGVYKPRNIDKAVEQFCRLSYLGLRLTFIDFLPKSVGELQCLETLDLKHTRIHDIPSQVWNAKMLKHLYLSWINGLALPINEVTDCNSSPKPPNLHTLWGLYLKNENSSAINFLINFGSLRRLGLTYNSKSNEVGEWVSKLTSLRSLKLKYIKSDGVSSEAAQRSTEGEADKEFLALKKMDKHAKLEVLYLRGRLDLKFASDEYFPPYLKTLTLSMTRLEVNPMPMLGKLNHLNILRLFADSYLGTELHVSHGFPELRVLKLWKLRVEVLIFEKEAMPHLRELEVRSCSTLKVIEGSEHLTSLNEIVLTNMPFNLLRSLQTKNRYVKRVEL